MRSFEKREAKEFQAIFPATPPEGIDLLRRMLTFDPRKRITLAEVIEHPFFANFRDPNLEILADVPPTFNWEQEPNLDMDRVKELLA
jgi:serine/threonine protein kinase